MKNIIFFVIILCFIGCDKDDSGRSVLEGRCREVSLWASSALSSKTALCDNGLSMKWENNDRISVWAYDDTRKVLDGQPFVIRYIAPDAAQARFTAEISPMPDALYTYYAVYPIPDSVEGNMVYFQLPTDQYKPFESGHDILVSVPEQNRALTIDGEPVSLSFKHKLHALKCYVPEGENGLIDPIKRVEMTFPVPVTGRLGIDYTDSDAAVVLTDGSCQMAVEIPEGLNASSNSAREYAYGLICPIEMAETEDVLFSVYSDFERASFTLKGKTFEAGSITPVRLRIPGPDEKTTLRFMVSENHLGETPYKITFTAPEGVVFAGGKNVAVVEKTFETGTTADLFLYESAANFSGCPLTVTYESESAIVSEIVTVPELSLHSVNTLSLTVPYLLAEDFSRVTDFEDGVSKTGGNSSGFSFYDKNYGLASGWTGARVEGVAGQSVRVSCRYESGMGIKAVYCGRLDSAPLQALKDGKTPTVRVEFKAAGNDNRYETTCDFGYTTTAGIIDGSNMSRDAYMEIVGDASRPIATINGVSYANVSTVGKVYSFDVPGNKNTRISWRVGTSRGISFAGNGNYYMYIDDIKVSIVK